MGDLAYFIYTNAFKYKIYDHIDMIYAKNYLLSLEIIHILSDGTKLYMKNAFHAITPETFSNPYLELNMFKFLFFVRLSFLFNVSSCNTPSTVRFLR